MRIPYSLFLIALIAIVGCKKSDLTGSYGTGPRYYTLMAHKGNGRVALDWGRAVLCTGFSCPPPFDAVRYQVLISETDTSNMREYGILSAIDQQITVDGLENGKAYFFKIKAIDGRNRVEESNPVMVVPNSPLPVNEVPLNTRVFSAVVSSDGRYVAYTADYSWQEDGNSYGTMVLYIREQGGEPYLAYMGASTPSWSPVENKVVFTTSSGRSTIAPGYRPERIGIYDLESGEVEYIADGEYRNMYPIWSPDGQRIAALSDRDERNEYDLWEVSLMTGQERLIGRMGYPRYEVASPMSWSLDGQGIVFSAKNHYSETFADYQIYSMNAQNGNRSLIAAKAWNLMSPSYSPDGKWLAFFSTCSGSVQLWAIELASGNIHQFTGEVPIRAWSSYQNRISWSKNGDKLYFHAYNDASPQSSSLFEVTLQEE